MDRRAFDLAASSLARIGSSMRYIGPHCRGANVVSFGLAQNVVIQA